MPKSLSWRMGPPTEAPAWVMVFSRRRATWVEVSVVPTLSRVPLTKALVAAQALLRS